MFLVFCIVFTRENDDIESSPGTWWFCQVGKNKKRKDYKTNHLALGFLESFSVSQLWSLHDNTNTNSCGVLDLRKIRRSRFRFINYFSSIQSAILDLFPNRAQKTIQSQEGTSKMRKTGLYLLHILVYKGKFNSFFQFAFFFCKYLWSL